MKKHFSFVVAAIALFTIFAVAQERPNPPSGGTVSQTVIGAGGASQTLSWAAPQAVVEITETANLTVSFSGNTDGYNLTVSIIGDASHTVTWPSSGSTKVHWTSSDGTPTQTLSKTDVYTFVQIHGIIYGSAKQGF